jgi:hypothetical protein
MKKNIFLKKILLANKKQALQYKKNALMLIINSKKMTSKKTRETLLACIQTLSDYFQRVVTLRHALCEDPFYLHTAQEHFKEEFLHNITLMKERKEKPAKWDPILESTSSWFAWKMFTLSEQEKTLLIHFVLETSGNIFFQKSYTVMKKYGQTEYFRIHSEADEEHEKMGLLLLKNLSEENYPRMLLLLKQGWGVLNAACNRMAEIALQD